MAENTTNEATLALVLAGDNNALLRFIEQYEDVKQQVMLHMDEALQKAIGNKVIVPDKLEGNYNDVYPFIDATLKNFLKVNKPIDYSGTLRHDMRVRKYLEDHRVWHHYAGDYRAIASTD